jgi:hypothetical protein
MERRNPCFNKLIYFFAGRCVNLRILCIFAPTTKQRSMRSYFHSKSAILLGALLHLSFVTLSAQQLSGTGSETDPYRISTRADLEDLKNYLGAAGVDKHFRLTADIDLNDADWTPIGGAEPNAFRGKLHGGGHHIKNISVDAASDVQYIGLFGVLGSGAAIDSVHIVGGEIKGGSVGVYAGALAGLATNSEDQSIAIDILGCSNSAQVNTDGKTEANTGGLVGKISSQGTAQISLTGCVNTGTVIGGGNCTGGLVGSSSGGSVAVSDSYNQSLVRATKATGESPSVGGLVGYILNTGSDPNMHLENCYAAGWVHAVASNAWVGGLAGYVDVSSGIATIKKSVAAQDSLTGPAGNTHRIVGYNSGGTLASNYAYEVMLVNGNIEENGASTNIDGLDKLLTDLHTKTTYAGTGLSWNIGAGTETWNIHDKKSFPYLQWQSAPVAVYYLYCDTVHFDMQDEADSVLVYAGATFLEKISNVSTGKYFLSSTIHPGDVLSFIAYYPGKEPSYPVAREVSKRNITISAFSQIITYGDDGKLDFGQGGGYAITAGALSDGHTLSGALTLNNATKSTGGFYKAGSYTFGFGDIKVMESTNDVTADYYNITSSNATVTINKLTLTHSVKAERKVYDATVAATYTGAPTNVKEDDIVEIDLGFGLEFKDANVGDDKAVVLVNEGLWALVGPDGKNYVFPPWDTTKTYARANITVRDINSGITATAAPQTYTSSACTTTVTVAFGVATLTKDVDYTIDGYSNNINAGQATVTIRGAGNYDPTTTKDISFTIYPKPIQVAELTAQNKTYDGTTAATLTFNEATFKNKLFDADRDGITVNYPTTGTFNQANVTNGKVIPSSYVTLDGDKADNYTVIQQTDLPAIIEVKSMKSEDITVNPVLPRTYTGSAIEPDWEVYDGNTLLQFGLGKDYYVEYNGNIDVGCATATIRGMGNYNNSVEDSRSATFTIVQKAITVEELTAVDKIFDGTDAATVTFNEAAFRQNKLAAADRSAITITAPSSGTFAQSDVGDDITVTTTDVVLTGTKAGNYAVTQQTVLQANITPKPITASDLNIAPVPAETYTGAAIKPPVVVTEGGNTLRPGQDYGATYTNNTNAGTATITVKITDTGNYSGDASTSTTFTILKKPVTVTELTAKDKTYDGTTAATVTFNEPAFKTKLVTDDLPHITITAPSSGTFAQSNVGDDITVTAASVTLSGAKAGNYAVTQQTGLQANITPKPITASDLNIAPVPVETYTGAAIEPPVVVTEGGNTLRLGQDYGAIYTNNTNAGMATITVTITNTGNYTGSASTITTFVIEPKDINAADIAIISDQPYTGVDITPELTVTDGVMSLEKDKDYTIDYNGNVDVGEAMVTITGRNNYTDTKQAAFTIVGKSIAGDDITIAPVPSQTYTGASLTPPVTVADGASTLMEVTDYTVSYNGNVNVGQATVTVTGTGNYDGSATVTFDIVKADQTIDFPDIPMLIWSDGSYLLRATVPSGLAITYTSSNPAIAEIGSDGVTLLLKDFGSATITADQGGNSNYNPAPPIQRQVTIVESGNVNVSNVTVIGAVRDAAVNNRHVMNCGEHSVTVMVETEDYTARVYHDNVLGKTFTVSIPTVGVHTITYTVASGANTREYPLEIARPFEFDSVAVMRWDNTLTVINNPANNGGFHFTSFAWYGDGRLITTGQSFSAGNNGQTLDPSVYYHLVLEAEEYTGALNTCPSLVALRQSAIDMVAYPNPAQSNSVVFVEINMDEALFDHAEIEILNIIGASMGKMRVAGRITPVNMSSLPTGIYLLNLRGKHDLNKIVKVVVQ